MKGLVRGGGIPFSDSQRDKIHKYILVKLLVMMQEILSSCFDSFLDGPSREILSYQREGMTDCAYMSTLCLLVNRGTWVIRRILNPTQTFDN